MKKLEPNIFCIDKEVKKAIDKEIKVKGIRGCKTKLINKDDPAFLITVNSKAYAYSCYFDDIEYFAFFAFFEGHKVFVTNSTFFKEV